MKTLPRIAHKVVEREKMEAWGYRIRLCPTCNHSGRDPQKRQKCPACGGRGYTFHRPS